MPDQGRITREYVLSAVANDYESFDMVFKEVTGWATEHAIWIDAQTIEQALKELIDQGYVQAYILSAGPPGKAEPAPYSPDRIEDLWFYVTPKGKQLAHEVGCMRSPG